MTIRASGFELEIGYESQELLRRYGGVTAQIMRITPPVAREMLAKNTKNRKPNKRHIDHMAHVIEEGDMVMNGEAIILAADGTLLNGQHRLFAVLKTGKSFDALVVSGIDIQAFKTLDGGRKRQTFEILAMKGEGNAAAVAAAVQAVLAFVDHGGKISSTSVGARKATPALAERILDLYPQIRKSVVEMRRSPHMKNQHGFCLHFIFSLVNKRLAQDFSDVLADGSDDRWRPFNVLREYYIRHPMTNLDRRSHSARAVKAFNAEVSGARPKTIPFGENEEFPAIAGFDVEELRDMIG